MLRFSRSEMIQRFYRHFERLYGDGAERCMQRLRMLLGRYGVGWERVPERERWSERDVALITYADMVRKPGEVTFKALKRFLDQRLDGVVNTVHILPFFPYSSDDGFSVIDYRLVKEAYGDWPHVQALGENFRLAFDLVLNHCSRRSVWFRDYCNGVAPGRNYFHTVEPETDLSAVVRPRSKPLLTEVTTRAGSAHVWTTFSPDQVDLNFANPDVLFEFIDILLFYVSQGARILRLDAIAYLWKEIGTSCIHLPQTHEVVKLFHDILAVIAPNVLLLTETNVPHAENISYFGEGDEADMVYQFSLPPLLLQALTSGDARHLTEWAGSLGAIPPECTYFNFTASHDGIGVRPLEGLVPEPEREALVERMRTLGAHISTKRNADGTDSAYELNITYFDALADDPERVTENHIERFLTSQSIMLAMAGMPAIYFHSLTATRNWTAGYEQTGEPRTLNRRKFEEDEINAILDEPESAAQRVFEEYTRRIRVRTAQPAFHPEGPQEVLDLGPELFGLVRTAPDGSQTLVCLSNVTDQAQRVALDGRVPPVEAGTTWRDLLDDAVTVAGGQTLALPPYRTAWLAPAE